MRGAIGVQAAALTAVARLAVGLHAHMAELARALVLPAIRAAVHVDGPADAAAEREVHQVGHLALTVHLRGGRGVRVVEQRAGIGERADEALERDVHKREDVRILDTAALCVHDGGDGDAYAEHRAARRPGFSQQGLHLAGNSFGIFRAEHEGALYAP